MHDMSATSETLGETWFLAQVKPNCEAVAERNLARQGIGTFLPREDVTREQRGRFVAKRGEGTRALSIAFVSSLTGGIFGAFALSFAVVLAKPIILQIGFGEQFMLVGGCGMGLACACTGDVTAARAGSGFYVFIFRFCKQLR